MTMVLFQLMYPQSRPLFVDCDIALYGLSSYLLLWAPQKVICGAGTDYLSEYLISPPTFLSGSCCWICNFIRSILKTFSFGNCVVFFSLVCVFFLCTPTPHFITLRFYFSEFSVISSVTWRYNSFEV